MKILLVTMAVVGIAALGFVTRHKPLPPKKTSTTVNGIYQPIAVLELFTSEGCSSCPVADNLLPELVKLDANVIALSFHVDYWDRLGWKDPFSSSEATDRQRYYVNQLNLEGAYTPQLVVNGEYELVGSNRGAATNSIKKALAEKASVEISKVEMKRENATISVSCEAKGDLAKTNLLAALVEKNAMTDVKAGENRGVKLNHTNIVRAFSKENASAKNNFTLNVPKGLADDNWKIIVYAQENSSGKITGATVFNPK